MVRPGGARVQGRLRAAGAAEEASMSAQAEKTRNHWLAVLEKHRHDPDGPARPDMWSPALDGASRDELIAI